MSISHAIAGNAALIADPSRAAMLSVLLDGRALPAGELAAAADITAQTASSHLSKLLDAGLIACESQGRHRYYRLADVRVAEALEHLAGLNSAHAVRTKSIDPQLQFARRCYDHLAGRLGVAVTDALTANEFIRAAANKQFEITREGNRWFARVGVQVETLSRSTRGIARQCLDWTERRHHLAGPLGVRLLAALCERDWLRRSRSSRCVIVTAQGAAALRRELGMTINLSAQGSSLVSSSRPIALTPK
jgi:DNA-binding transcriptional ArsR family regulator